MGGTQPIQNVQIGGPLVGAHIDTLRLCSGGRRTAVSQASAPFHSRRQEASPVGAASRAEQGGRIVAVEIGSEVGPPPRAHAAGYGAWLVADEPAPAARRARNVGQVVVCEDSRLHVPRELRSQLNRRGMVDLRLGRADLDLVLADLGARNRDEAQAMSQHAGSTPRKRGSSLSMS